MRTKICTNSKSNNFMKSSMIKSAFYVITVKPARFHKTAKKQL